MTQEQLSQGIELRREIDATESFISRIERSYLRFTDGQNVDGGEAISLANVKDELYNDFKASMDSYKLIYIEHLNKRKNELLAQFTAL